MPTLEAVKERPILFSGPMVKALLDGRKTQTRRIIKPQPIEGSTLCLVVERPGYGGSGVVFTGPDGMDARPKEWQKPSTWSCPYGQPGDRFWVRETWAKAPKGHIFKADFKVDDGFGSDVVDLATGEMVPLVWKSPIHMPRALSRITLEVAEVRVERFLSISEADKLAEGATPEMPYGTIWRKLHTRPGERFEDNPWVWAITFRRLEAQTS